mgnify:CR=1 FL=1
MKRNTIILLVLVGVFALLSTRFIGMPSQANPCDKIEDQSKALECDMEQLRAATNELKKSFK